MINELDKAYKIMQDNLLRLYEVFKEDLTENAEAYDEFTVDDGIIWFVEGLQ